MPRETKTILLIHGLWLTPACWEPFRQRYEAQGYRVLTPTWSHLWEAAVDARPRSTAPPRLGVQEIVEHYEVLIRELDRCPILIGHGLGGLVVQLLLDQGLGAAGIAMNATAPGDVWRVSWSKLAALGPILAKLGNYNGSSMMSFPQFRSTMANTMSETAAHEVYKRCAMPALHRLVLQAALANWNPWGPTRVRRDHDQRAPLLLLAGTEDRLSPPLLSRVNFRKYADMLAVTDYTEFDQRSHLMMLEAGWQEVADYALSWAETHVEHAESWLLHGVG